MLWRLIHRFLGWMFPAFGAAYGATLGIAATAASTNLQAKAFLDGQIAMLERIVTASLFPLWLVLIVAVWLFAFLWSGHKAAAYDLANRQIPVAVQPRRQAVSPRTWEQDVARRVRRAVGIEVDPDEILDALDRVRERERRAVGAPKEANQVTRDKGLSEALAYAISGQWGARFIDCIGDGFGDAGDTWQRARQLAGDGVLTVWGKRSPNHLHQKIPPEYWIDHQPEWFDLLRGKARTEVTTLGASPEKYTDLMVSSAEFEKEWPHERHSK